MSKFQYDYLGRYKLVERIGQGGMAEVYRAYDPEIDREVAIKVLRNYEDYESNEGEDLAARFKREIAVMSALKHPNILRAYDSGQHEEVVYLVMSFFGGGSLEKRLARGARFSLDQTNSLVQQISLGLGFAHSQGVVHRDIKPANVLIHHIDGHLVLSDFGIAKALGGTTHLTGTGVGLGTPTYMSPEQMRGDAYPTSDIYSMGIMAFRCIAGKTPFTGQNYVEIAYKHTYEQVPLLKDYGFEDYGELDEFFQKSMAKKPDDRYQSVGDFAQAFSDASQLVLTKQGQRLQYYSFPPKTDTNTSGNSGIGTNRPTPTPSPSQLDNIYSHPQFGSFSNSTNSATGGEPSFTKTSELADQSATFYQEAVGHTKAETANLPALSSTGSASTNTGAVTNVLETTGQQAVGSQPKKRGWLVIILPTLAVILVAVVMIMLISVSGNNSTQATATAVANAQQLQAQIVEKNNVNATLTSGAVQLQSGLTATASNVATATQGAQVAATATSAANDAATVTEITNQTAIVLSFQQTATANAPTPTPTPAPITIFGDTSAGGANANDEPQNATNQFTTGATVYLALNFANAQPNEILSVKVINTANNTTVWTDSKAFGKSSGFITFNHSGLPAGAYQATFQARNQNQGQPINFTIVQPPTATPVPVVVTTQAPVYTTKQVVYTTAPVVHTTQPPVVTTTQPPVITTVKPSKPTPTPGGDL